MLRALDYGRLFVTHLAARVSILKKSPVNFWFAIAIQIVYYMAQALFWIGIRSVDPGREIASSQTLFGFLLTLAVVDNAYLMLFGEGSLNAQKRITSATLEPVLTAPRHPLFMFVFMYVNVSHLPGTLLSLGLLGAYYQAYDVPMALIASHLAGMVIGIGILNGISFLYRLSTFWTAAIVAVRNSNPSFKVMVRPLDAFQGPVRLALMTVLPALFITGVPSSVLNGSVEPSWIALGALALAGLWATVLLIWTKGVRRYQLMAT